MFKRIICISTITAIISLLFTGCFLKKEPEPFSEYDANEAALAYLKDKYGEEYVVVKSGRESTGEMYNDDAWQEIIVSKKAEGNCEFPRQFRVCVSRDNSYTILGDTVMSKYYENMYYDFANPLIGNEIGDIPYELVVKDIVNKNNTVYYGFTPEAKIPHSFDDTNCIIDKGSFELVIFIPESYDNDKIPAVCKKIKERLTEENYFNGYFSVLDDKDYNDLISSEDKYWICCENRFFIGKKTIK